MRAFDRTLDFGMIAPMTQASGTLILLAVLVPFALAALTLGAGALGLGRRAALMMILGAAFSLACCSLALPHALAGEPLVFRAPWIASLGVAFSLRADPFGLMFALLISGVGTLVGVYASMYLRQLAAARLAQFYAALLAFMGAMLGVALADDLVLLFAFWELTSLCSFLLIGFWYEEDAAVDGALTALQVTALGGMVMMAGVVLIGVVTGTFSLTALAHDETVRSTLVASPAFTPALALMLAGALTKSAQWPFHFWLPGAMVAPTPVSAYLHAATMVKAGVFLLGRLLPLFALSALWSGVLVPIGLLTFLLGAFQAMRATDLKAILARTTLATLGMLTFQYGLGFDDQDALQFLSHAAYKGALFLTAGILEHAAHTRDLRRMGGLRSRMPITFAVCLIAALSMAGVWPTLGFHAKETTYHALLHADAVAAPLRVAMLAAAVAANALLVAVALRLVVGIFFGPPTAQTEDAHDPHPALWAPPGVLAAIALIAGIAAEPTARLVAALSSDPGAHVHLSLLPAAAEAGLTLLTTIGGLALYFARDAIAALPGPRATLDEAWHLALDAVARAATWFSDRWQNGSVYWYFAGTLSFTVALTALALWRHDLTLGAATVRLEHAHWLGVTLCAMLAVSAMMVVRFTTRVGAAIALTANGFFTALLFVVYRSPDILLTQMLIETVSTIFILLILYFMPPFRPDPAGALKRAASLAVSAAVGVMMFALVLLATSDGLRETRNLAADYLSRSLAEAGGANAVNVIIVDFRAIDTTGEVTVVTMVALLVYGLLRTRRDARGASPVAKPDVVPRTPARAGPTPAQALLEESPARGGDVPILHTVAAAAVPLTAWVSAIVFLQGHNLPGGGFIAGVMAAAAGATYMLAFGVARAARVPWWRVAVCGLLVAVTTGAVPFVLGGSFLDHEIWHFHVPLVGETHFPTATFFDLGVYLIVLGAIMTVFVELAQEDG